MADYTTTYVFNVSIQGQKAAEQAKEFRAAVEKQLGSLKVGVETGGLETRLKNLKDSLGGISPQLKNLRSNLGDTSTQSSELAKQAIAAEQGMVALSLGASEAAAKLVESKGGVDAMAVELGVMTKEAYAAKLALKQVAEGTRDRPLTGPQKLGDAFTEGIIAGTKEMWALRRMSYDFQYFGSSIERAGMQVIQAMKGMSESHLEFERGIIGAQSAMDLQIELLPQLRDEVKATSEEIGRFSAAEITEGIRMWAAGMGETVTTSRQLSRVIGDVTQIQKLAAISYEDLGGVVDFVGGTIQQFGLGVEDVKEVTELMNWAAQRSRATLGDLGQSLRYVGNIAYEAGVPIEEVTAALMVMSDANIRSTMGGRAMRQMFLQLAKPTKEHAKAMNELLGTTGEGWMEYVYDAQGTFIGLGKYIQLLTEVTWDLTDAQRASALATMATSNEMPALLALMAKQREATKVNANVLEVYGKQSKGVVDAEVQRWAEWSEQQMGLPFAMVSAAERTERDIANYETSDVARMDRLKNRWENLILDIGELVSEDLIDAFEMLIDTLNDVASWFKKNPEIAKMILEGAKYSFIGGKAMEAAGWGMRAATTYGIFKYGAQSAAEFAKTGAAAAGGAGAVAGRAVAGGAAGTLGFLGPMIGAGAVAWAVNAIADALTKREREETARMVSEAEDPVQTELLRLFRETKGGYVVRAPFMGGIPGGPGYETEVARIKEANALIKEATGRTAGLLEELSGEDLDKVLKLLARKFIGGVEEMATDMELVLAARAQAAAPGGRPTIGGDRALSEEEKEQARLYYEFEKDRIALAEQFGERRMDIVDGFNDWVRDGHEDLLKDLEAMDADYTLTLGRKYEDYQNRRQKIIDGANINEQRAADQHAKKLRDIELGHRDKMVDLLEEQDVRGITQEMRRYKRQRDSLGEGSADATKKRQQDTAQKLEEERKRFELENKRRAEDYATKRANLQTSFDEEREVRRAAMKEDLEELATDEQETLTQLKDDFYESIVGIDKILEDKYPELLGKVTAFVDGYVYQIDRISKKWMELAGVLGPAGEASAEAPAMQTPGGLEQFSQFDMPGMAAGGYAASGMYRLHAGEFVLNKDTTSFLEKNFGYLSQEKMKGVGGDIYSFNPVFQGVGALDAQKATELFGRMWNLKTREMSRRVRSYSG